MLLAEDASWPPQLAAAGCQRCHASYASDARLPLSPRCWIFTLADVLKPLAATAAASQLMLPRQAFRLSYWLLAGRALR
jgi:hypothetical protein